MKLLKSGFEFIFNKHCSRYVNDVALKNSGNINMFSDKKYWISAEQVPYTASSSELIFCIYYNKNNSNEHISKLRVVFLLISALTVAIQSLRYYKK